MKIKKGAHELSSQIIEKKCLNCKYHDDYSWACFNGDSDERGDFTDNEMHCEHWENKGEVSSK